MAVLIRPTLAQNNDDYVKEVLEEDYRNDDDYENPYSTDAEEDKKAKRKQDEERGKATKAETLAKQKAEKVEREREAKFESELSRMSADKQKAAKKRKKVDAKMVSRVLKAAANNNHYAVLGLTNLLEVKIPSRSVSIGSKVNFTIPGFKLFHITPTKIRRAYKRRAIAVHPDKNRDGRANEAFIAVENSASILSDVKLRTDYDKSVRLLRRQRRQKVTSQAGAAMDVGVSAMTKGFAVFRSVLGPFAFPVLIVGSLIA